MRIDALDHLVLTVATIPETCAFYERALGMEIVTFGNGRTALAFGSQKMNLHQAGQEFEPKAMHPTPGSADVCLLTRTPISDVLSHLAAQAVPVVDGPVQRTGATGVLLSVYVRDPDGNLVEISNVLLPTADPLDRAGTEPEGAGRAGAGTAPAPTYRAPADQSRHS